MTASDRRDADRRVHACRRGTLPVMVRLLDALPPGDDRKAMARHAQAAISAALNRPN